MKLKTLINKLEKLKQKHGNIEVIIDYGDTDAPEEGWYSCDTVEMVKWSFWNKRVQNVERNYSQNRGSL